MDSWHCHKSVDNRIGQTRCTGNANGSSDYEKLLNDLAHRGLGCPDNCSGKTRGEERNFIRWGSVVPTYSRWYRGHHSLSFARSSLRVSSLRVSSAHLKTTRITRCDDAIHTCLICRVEPSLRVSSPASSRCGWPKKQSVAHACSKKLRNTDPQYWQVAHRTVGACGKGDNPADGNCGRRQGALVTAGDKNYQSDSLSCCDSCRRMGQNKCNVWVWCGNTGGCDDGAGTVYPFQASLRHDTQIKTPFLA